MLSMRKIWSCLPVYCFADRKNTYSKKEEWDGNEKAKRVISLIDAVENLSLVVRGNLDNAEPLFVVGGLSERKTHYLSLIHI